MRQYKTLYEIIKKRGTDKDGITLILDEKTEEYIPNNEMYKMALNILGELQAAGIGPDTEVVVAVDDLKTYLGILWASILGKIKIAPVGTGTREQHKSKIFWMLDKLNNPFLITSAQNLETLKEFSTVHGMDSEFMKLRSRIILSDGLGNGRYHGIEQIPSESDTAVIIFTSGSTGKSKGFCLTHENLISSIYAGNERFKVKETDICLNWTPVVHGMGLILYYLSSLAAEAGQYLMPTETFIVSPALWLQKATQYKATILYATNSACVHLMEYAKYKEERTWNLDNVRLICNGGEPLTQNVCEEFLNRMAKYGLKRNAMRPGYGIAEAGVAACFTCIDEEVNYVHINRHSIGIGNIVEYLDCGKEGNSLTLVDLGPPVKDFFVKICNKAGKELGEDTAGCIFIRGKNVTKSYYNNAEETQKMFTEDGWLNTGDIGFIKGGNLVFITRAKDMICAGDNFYSPNDIENIAEEYSEIKPRTVIAAGIYNEETEKDEIIVFIQNRKLKAEEFSEVSQRVKKYFLEKADIKIDRVVQIMQIFRTTSGKEQRFLLAEQYKKMRA